MSSSFVLGLDLGTTGVRAVLYRPDGRLVSKSYISFRQYYPKPGWVEHDPEEIFSSTLRMIRRSCRTAKINFHQIASIGITNQRETVVIWSKKTGKPVHRAIVWQDRRTEAFCRDLKTKGLEQTIRRKTGLVIDPYFSATKIRWLLDHVPGLRREANAGKVLAGTIDSWVLWRLTKVHATDFTNASRTLVFNIHKKCWDPELLNIFGIPAGLLPQVFPSGCEFGRTITLSGISAGVPVCAILGDQQAALYGQNCVRSGEVKNTYGTGCFMVMNVGRKKPHAVKGLLVTLAADEKGRPVYAFEGAVFIAGAVIQWLRDELKMITRADETEKIAFSVPDTHGLTLIPAFVGLGSPHWRADVRGAALGITRGVSRAHWVRAALESIAQQSADVLDAMRKACPQKIRRMRADGKATENRFLMQYQADLLGIPVSPALEPEVTVWGAARLAGEQIRFWDKKRNPSHTLSYQVYRPKWKSKQRRASRESWKAALNHLLKN